MKGTLLVEETDLPVRVTLRQLGVPRSIFYDWYQRYEAEGFDGLEDKKPTARPCWNAIPEAVRDRVFEHACAESPRPACARTMGSGNGRPA